METMLASYLTAKPRTLPEALGRYISNTSRGETTRERVAVSLYYALPVAARLETLGAIE